MYRHILIPTDGSELAERAVTHGLSLAKFVGARVTVLTVIEQLDAWFSFPEHGVTMETFVQYSEQMKKRATIVLDRVANAAGQAGVPCETTQAEDVPPYEAIIAAATDRGCDLIVMASHGRSGLSAILLGSVTSKVLTYTKTPVLVCQ